MVPRRHLADLIRATAESHLRHCLFAVGHLDLPFMVPALAVGVHITVQGASRLPDPIEQRLPQLLDAVEGEFAQTDTFDATLAEPVVGNGGVVCDVSPRERFEAIRDATRRGLDRLVSVPQAAAFDRPISQRAHGPRRPTRGARLA